MTSADDPNKKELLRITMSLREANKISQSLSKHIVSNKKTVSHHLLEFRVYNFLKTIHPDPDLLFVNFTFSSKVPGYELHLCITLCNLMLSSKVFFLIPLQTFSRDDVFVDGKVTKSLLYLSWRTSLLVKNSKHITCGITISHSRSKCFSLRFGYPKTVFLNLSCPFTVFKKTERSQVENPTRPAT